MAIFKNTYSGLITKGLGMSACCGMLTLGFGLFVCKIEVIIPPEPTPGGMGVLYPGKIGPGRISDDDHSEIKKRIRLTVRMKNSHMIVKEYEIGSTKAKVAIKSINVINAARAKVSVAIDTIKRVLRRITVVFPRSDK